MEKYLIEERKELLLPYINCAAVLPEFPELLTNTLISELRVIAVVAKSVDAIMLLRIV